MKFPNGGISRADEVIIADSETIPGVAAYSAESVLCHLRLNGIVTFRMLLVSACLFVLTTTGLTGLHVVDSPPIPILLDTPEYAPLDENAPQAAGTVLSGGFENNRAVRAGR